MNFSSKDSDPPRFDTFSHVSPSRATVVSTSPESTGRWYSKCCSAWRRPVLAVSAPDGSSQPAPPSQNAAGARSEPVIRLGLHTANAGATLV